MQPDQVLSQLREVGAAVGALLDAGVEILSIHIGPTTHPPTLRVMPCTLTRQLAARAWANPYSGELNVAFAYVELAWVEPGRVQPESGLGQAAIMADTLARLEGEIAAAARQVGVA